MRVLSAWLARADTEVVRDICAGVALLTFCAAALAWLPVIANLAQAWRPM
jgi:hypothetical protein